MAPLVRTQIGSKEHLRMRSRNGYAIGTLYTYIHIHIGLDLKVKK